MPSFNHFAIVVGFSTGVANLDSCRFPLVTSCQTVPSSTIWGRFCCMPWWELSSISSALDWHCMAWCRYRMAWCMFWIGRMYVWFGNWHAVCTVRHHVRYNWVYSHVKCSAGTISNQWMSTGKTHRSPYTFTNCMCVLKAFFYTDILGISSILDALFLKISYEIKIKC